MQYIFRNKYEKKIYDTFLSKGFVIFKVKDQKSLNYLKKKTQYELNKIVKKADLKNIHNFVKPEILNNLRMKIYNKINSNKKFLNNYFYIVKNELEIICGNELAMQRKVNLSIQMPNDDSSLLPIHSDVWSGCSPFEVVVWIPLVNCEKTNSIFFLSKNKSNLIQKKFNKIKDLNRIEKTSMKNIKFVKIKYGEALIFSHQLLHGNIINKEKSTRWSFNCRFKSLFSPFHEKTLGETFIPIQLKPASKFGIKFNDKL